MSPQSLERKAFATSRLADFTSIPELQKQTGHAVGDWPLVVLKELLDNAVDAAEKAGTAPVVDVSISAGSITVIDNGPGIKPEIVAKMLDFNVLVSDKSAYVSPTRGAQGNALKTIIAMPFALDGKKGSTIIDSCGVRHSIVFEVDPIRMDPKIRREPESGSVRNGTLVQVGWPSSPRSELDSENDNFLLFADNYAILNPHLTLRLMGRQYSVIDPGFRKWTSSDQIPASWYSLERFERLIASHIANDEDHGGKTTVRDFVGTFRGLSGSAKRRAVLEELGASRQSLAEFFDKGGNRSGVQRLLNVMQRHGTTVDPKALGIIGKDNLKARFSGRSEMETFEYSKVVGEHFGLPFIVECAFAWTPGFGRRVVTGINFSASIIDPFRSLNGESLADVLGEQFVHQDDEIMLVVHLVYPSPNTTDRGKTAVALPFRIADAIAESIRKMTAKWKRTRKAEIKDERNEELRKERMTRSRKVSKKAAAAEVMEKAYLAASDNGSLPAKARQIYYAARNHIQERTGKMIDGKYFSKFLLPDFVMDHPNLCANWDVVFDDRGHFTEPHGGDEIGIGTVSVRNYLAKIGKPEIKDADFAAAKVKTRGPQGNYGAMLYIEKEGFKELFDAVQLADRFDIGIMSNKGTSVTAGRQLVEHICGERGIPLYVLHDFDKAGFSIKATLQRDTRRYKFRHAFEAIDLGLRLEDVRAFNLEGLAERAAKEKGSREARAKNMRRNGATEEEIDFLLDRRVELNAMTSRQLVQMVESKLIAHGVGKVIPADDVLAKTYESFVTSKKIKKTIDDVIAKRDAESVDIPDGLRDRIAEHLERNPEKRWDEALAEIIPDD
jgi:DNA topoisomerase VI subunit B